MKVAIAGELQGKPSRYPEKAFLRDGKRRCWVVACGLEGNKGRVSELEKL